jgi:hypothetical protein
MSTSKAPPDIIQEGEKNPRGIPKAIFIVRLWSFRAAQASRSRFADLLFYFIIVTPPSIRLSVRPLHTHRTTWRNISGVQMQP